jgi:hypothetical protein
MNSEKETAAMLTKDTFKRVEQGNHTIHAPSVPLFAAPLSAYQTTHT